jgi:hypothetical protein
MCLATTPGVTNTNHEPSHPATISLSCQEMSQRINLIQVVSKRNSVIQDITLEKNVPYSVFENIFISYQTRYSSRNTNRYRITMCKISENNIHPIPFTKSLCSTSGCSANRCMAFARCEGGRSFPAVCSGPNSPGSCACNSCMSQVAGPGPHTKISYNF